MSKHLTTWPDGWWIAGHSDTVSYKDVVRIDPFGKPFVLWRGRNGQLHCTGAYCPHFGADLGSRGEVLGDEIRCNYHAWRFDGEGCNTSCDIGTSAIGSQLGTMPVAEDQGLIYLWHGEGEPTRDIPRPDLQGAIYRTWDQDVDAHWYTTISHAADHGHVIAFHNVGALACEFEVEDTNVWHQVMSAQGLAKIEQRVYPPGIIHVVVTSEFDDERTDMWSGALPLGEGKVHYTVSFYGTAKTEEVWELTKFEVENDLALWETTLPDVPVLAQSTDAPLVAFLSWLETLYQDAS